MFRSTSHTHRLAVLIVLAVLGLFVPGEFTPNTLWAFAAKAPLAPAERTAPHEAAPTRPSSIVTELRPATNPHVPLGEWKVYATSNSAIASNYIYAVALDSTGRPWVGTDNGLSVFDGSNWTNHTSPDLVNNRAVAVGIDSRDQVWVGSPRYFNGSAWVDGGVAVRRANGTWAQYLPGYYVTSIATNGTEVFVGTWPYSNGGPNFGGGVAQFDASTNPPTLVRMITSANTSGGLANDTINAIAIGPNYDANCGGLSYWFAHSMGVSVYSRGSLYSCNWFWYTLSPSNGDPLPSATITSMTFDSHNRVWFGSTCGIPNKLTVLDGAAWITYTVANSGLTSPYVAALATDRQGRVWIGQGGETCLNAPTYPSKQTLNVFEDNGLYGQADDYWCYYETYGGTCQNPPPPSGLPSNYVRAIAASQERLWLGTWGGGMAAVTLNWKTFTDYNSSLYSNHAQALWLDSNSDQVWIGEPGGVDRFDGDTWRYYPIASGLIVTSAVGIKAMHRDDAGRLWAGERWYDLDWSERASVWLYQPISDTWRQYLVPGPGGVTSLSSDTSANKRLWIGTSGGGAKVFNVTSSSWVSLTTSNTPILSDHVTVVARDTADRMWIGGPKGLSVYTGTGWLTYTVTSTAGGLISDSVLALAADGLGRMWVGTDAGISVLNGTAWATYTVASTGGGLGANQVDAIAVDPANRVWFGTTNGVSVFDGSRWQKFSRLNSGLVDNVVTPRSLAADNSDGVWIGTDFGLSIRGVLTGPVGLPAPTITSFSPSSGPVDTVVTVYGTNFFPGNRDQQVFFTGPGGAWVEAVILNSSGDATSSALTVRVPFNAVKGLITVAHSGGVATSSSDFTPVPTVTDYSPTSAGVGLELVVHGANLGGANSRIRFSNGVEVHNEEPLVGNRLKITIPFSAASGPLMLITDGGSVTLSPAFVLAVVCPQRSDNTCVLSGDSTAIEINQGLPLDMYPLVAGKPTLVRVYVGSSISGTNVMLDFGMLTISGPSGASIRIATIPQTVFNNNVRDFSERRNVNFYLDGSEIPTSGIYTFDVTLRVRDSTIYSAKLSPYIYPTQDITFLPVVWGDNPTFDELNALVRAMATLERAYPVRRGGVIYQILPGFQTIPARFYTGNPPRPNVICDSIGGFYEVTVEMDALRIASYDFIPDNAVGFVPERLDPIIRGGCAHWKYPLFGLSTTNMNMLITGTNASGLFASQEVAHNFGLVYGGPTDNGNLHSKNQFVRSPGGPEPDPRAFNLATRRSVAKPPTIMWPQCCANREVAFFEPADFAPLINAIRSLSSSGTGLKPSSTTESATNDVFSIAGTINVTGTVNRTLSFVAAVGATVTPLSPGPYYLVFLDANNHVLASDGFSVSFAATHDGPSDTGLFSVARPMPDGTVRVEIRRDSTILATYYTSPNPPTVSITSPMGGSFGAAQNVTIAWTASDPDGDPLTFSAFYSRDDGVTWMALNAGMTDNSFVWNTGLAGGTAPGSFSRLKIMASDGFNTAEAVSSRFTVTGKPPIVSIIAPTAATRHVEGQLIYFEGLGTDLEDGPLPSSSLHWSSARDGVLGSGATLSATLTVGTHLVTLNGFDSNGNSAHDQGVVIVLPDFDGDGIPDADEPDNFWDPNDAGTVISGVTKLDYSSGITSPPTGAPGLAVNPSGLAMVAERGGSSAHGAITIQSTDLKPLSWTASKTQPWLSLSATSGATLATLDVTADPSGLGDGTYLDTIHIQAGALAQTVTVTLAVTSRAGPPQKVYLPIILR